MNQRFKELMIESMIETGRLEDVQATYQRFGEKVVRECLDQLFIDDPTEDFDRGVAWSVRQIKRHFGIEYERED